MLNKIYDDIKELFNSEVTTYQISKATGLAQPSLDNYRSGKSDIKNMKLSVAEKLHNFINKERLEMETIEQLENYIANYNESGNAVDPVLGMNKNDAQSLKKAYENGDLFLYDSESYSEYVNDSIEEYASDEKFIASFKNKLDEFESSKSRFVLEDTDGNVYFVK